MRILCINYEYPPIGGGGASACKGLLESFVREGHEVDIVTTGMKGLPEYEKVQGVNIYRVRCIRRHKHYATTPELISQVWPSYKKAVELIKKNKYDINHTHFIVPSGLVSYLIKRKTGLPYIVTAHGSDIAGYNPDRFSMMHAIMGPLWRMIVKNSAAVTAPSDFLKGLINNSMKMPVEVIPNGFSAKPAAELQRENQILVVTRMFERKGVQFLLEALQDAPKGWQVLIAGDGPYLPTLKSRASELGVSVKFLGQVPNDEIFEIYLKSRIYVFPSMVENFPVVLLEAMAAGCAVITTTAPGCAEVVGDSAIKVEAGSAEPIRNELHSLMNDPEQIERLGRLGQERVKIFAWPVITAKYIKAFDKIVDEQTQLSVSETIRDLTQL